MITITAKRDGFRRCGVAHTTKPALFLDDAFTPEQLRQLQAEPMLVVELLTDEPKVPGPDEPLKEDVMEGQAVAEIESQGPAEPQDETEEAKAATKNVRKKTNKE